MPIAVLRHSVKLWREDLGDSYIYLFKILVDDFGRFEEDLERYKNGNNGSALRIYRTAVILGIALVRESVFDKRYYLERLLGPEFYGYFSDRERMNHFLDGILFSEDGYNHVRRSIQYLNENTVWRNPSVHSLVGQKTIRAAFLRAAVRRHRLPDNFVPDYGIGISVVW